MGGVSMTTLMPMVTRNKDEGSHPGTPSRGLLEVDHLGKGITTQSGSCDREFSTGG